MLKIVMSVEHFCTTTPAASVDLPGALRSSMSGSDEVGGENVELAPRWRVSPDQVRRRSRYTYAIQALKSSYALMKEASSGLPRLSNSSYVRFMSLLQQSIVSISSSATALGVRETDLDSDLGIVVIALSLFASSSGFIRRINARHVRESR